VFNVGSPELLVILVVALLVLGPNKLPEAARQVGKAMGELRRLSSGFQAELRDAMQEPVASKPGTFEPYITPESAVVPDLPATIEPTVTAELLTDVTDVAEVPDDGRAGSTGTHDHDEAPSA
jgi:Tat protein translocase TatB subunit